MANIPNDIQVEILLKLPVYSLLRFRWACKYWFDLITRYPDCVKMHLFHSTSDHDELINKTLVLTSDGKYFYSNKYKDIFDTSSSSSSSPLKPAFMICQNPFGYKIEILGSCNGLICLLTLTSEYFLWNPSTTEFKKLPPVDKLYLTYPTIYGFGYDHSIDDYKVIVIGQRPSVPYSYNVASSKTSIIKIYTLGLNTWSTKIETNSEITELLSVESKSGVLVNGALHWMIRSRPGSQILCFDIVREKEHREIQLPPFNSAKLSDTARALRLQELNGCLCIFLAHSVFENAELWMMMDYSTGSKSWTKLFSIDVRSLIKEINHGKKCMLECTLKLLKYYSEDGGILMLCDQLRWGHEHNKKPGFKYLITYYPKKDKAMIRNTCMESGKNADTYYIESFVSVKSGMYLSNAVEGPSNC